MGWDWTYLVYPQNVNLFALFLLGHWFIPFLSCFLYEFFIFSGMASSLLGARAHVCFAVDVTGLQPHEFVMVCGSSTDLGRWDPQSALVLQQDPQRPSVALLVRPLACLSLTSGANRVSALVVVLSRSLLSPSAGRRFLHSLRFSVYLLSLLLTRATSSLLYNNQSGDFIPADRRTHLFVNTLKVPLPSNFHQPPSQC